MIKVNINYCLNTLLPLAHLSLSDTHALLELLAAYRPACDHVLNGAQAVPEIRYFRGLPSLKMISATRRRLRRHWTGIAIGAGVVGAGYLAAQYVVGKIHDARERMQMDQIAKEK